MTPAVRAAERAGVPFELLAYTHDPKATADALGAKRVVLADPAAAERATGVSVRLGRGDGWGWASYVRAHDPPDHVA